MKRRRSPAAALHKRQGYHGRLVPDALESRGPMKIALAQINPTIGDIAGNAQRIERAVLAARRLGADLVVLPELAIIGYPPRDLLLKPAVIDQCERAVRQLAAGCADIAAIIGYPARADVENHTGQRLYNAAAFCAQGRVVHCHVKSLLPTYDVFDERRYFEPGPSVDITAFAGARLGVSICEDLWNEQGVVSRRLYHDNPIDKLAALGAELFVNCSASPFAIRKQAFRLRLMSHVARRTGLGLMYCNQVGGNDELVFDGNSCAFDAGGNLIAHAKAFEEDLLVVDYPEVGSAAGAGDRGSGAVKKDAGGDGDVALEPRPDTRHPTPDARSPIPDLYAALVLGLSDYCRKCGFKDLVLGLSGGIDSAVTAAIAAAAVGAEHVMGVTMPSRHSSQGSTADSRKLADNLGIDFHTIPIAGPHDAFEAALAPLFEGAPPGVAEENIQARCRGVILMAISNKFNRLLVTTGNKSELAVGYCTLYGDMAGGLAILSDLPKTMVYELARWINTPDCPLHAAGGKAVIPEDTITKPPSAELRPDQQDADSLPGYDVLDDIIERYVEREHAAPRIIADTGYDAQLVRRIVKLIDRNEYKRKQMPPGLKVTGRAFGVGRRMPIAQRYDNAAAPAL